MVTTFFTDFVTTSLFSACLPGDLPLAGVFRAGDLPLEGVFLAGDLALEGVFLADLALEGVFLTGDLALEGVFLTGDFALDGVFLIGDLDFDGVFFAGDFAQDGVFFATFVFSAVDVSFGFSRCGVAFGVSANFFLIATVFFVGVCCFLGVSFLFTIFLLLVGVFFAEDTLGVRADLSRGVLGTAGLATFSGLDTDFRFLGGDLDALLFLLGDFDSDFARFAAGDFCLGSPDAGLGIFVSIDDFLGDAVLFAELLFGVIFFGDGFLGEALLEVTLLEEDFFTGDSTLSDFPSFTGDLLGDSLRRDRRDDTFGVVFLGEDFFGETFLGEAFRFGDDFFVEDLPAGLEIFVSLEDSSLLGLETFAGGGLLGEALFRFVVNFLGEGFLGETLLAEPFLFDGLLSAGDRTSA